MMTKLLRRALAACFLLTALAAIGAQARDAKALKATIDALATQLLAEEHRPGLTVAIVHEGEIVVQRLCATRAATPRRPQA
ncbi:MAG: hypothetical protein AAGA68_11460 [Pseudomonadota bacterium]